MRLSLSDVGYRYAAGTQFEHRALHGVELSVAPRELVLVLGATGSGKSTLLRLIAGLLEVQEGSALIDDAPLTRESARGRVGLVFQDPETQLFAESVMDDVSFGPANFGADSTQARAIAEEALRTVGLDPVQFADRSPFTLSGGEARRVAIAGVLAMTPDFLLLDEPTAGLDARGRSAVRTAIERARESAGVIVVSHSAEEFLGVADRVIALAHGACAWAGDASDLIAAPHVLTDVGLVPPAVLEVQRLCAASGLRFDATLDPVEAAERLARAREVAE